MAVTTSANTNKHQNFNNQYALNDTVPNPATDTMHNQNWNNNQNNMQDSSMQPRTDTASTAPPRK